MTSRFDSQVRVSTKPYHTQRGTYKSKAMLEREIEKALHNVDLARIRLFQATQVAQDIQYAQLTRLDELKADHISASSKHDAIKRIRGAERSLKAENQRSMRRLKSLQDMVQLELWKLKWRKDLKLFVGLGLEVQEMEKRKREGLLSPEQEEKLEEMRIMRGTLFGLLMRPRGES